MRDVSCFPCALDVDVAAAAIALHVGSEEKTFAHVTFASADSAAAAIGSSGVTVNGAVVVVEPSRSRGASRRRVAA